uniref:Neur_chan_LBD domain-containing protein n=1 Tax=Mesocestoides corti TaxID=53468 RepID=A0A5K3FTV6_MESCO
MRVQRWGSVLKAPNYNVSEHHPCLSKSDSVGVEVCGVRDRPTAFVDVRRCNYGWYCQHFYASPNPAHQGTSSDCTDRAVC